MCCCFFFQAEDGIRDKLVTGVQTCALPISVRSRVRARHELGDQLDAKRRRAEPRVRRGDLVEAGQRLPTLRGREACVCVDDEADELGAEEMLPVHQRLHDVRALPGVGLVDERELLTELRLVAIEGDPSAEEGPHRARSARSEEHTSELQSLAYLVCRL